MFRFLKHGDDRAIHYTLLHRFSAHVLLIIFKVDGMEELSVKIFSSIEALKMFLIVHVFTEGQPLLEVYLLIAGAHVLHDADFGRNLAFGCPSLRQERTNVWHIQVSIVIGSLLLPVDVVNGGVVEVMIIREGRLLGAAHLLMLPLGKLCGCKHF